MVENWKLIDGTDGKYYVSDLGRVYSLNSNIIMKTTIGTNGYKAVGIPVYKKVKKMSIHRLVAIAFVENPENKPQVDHINTDRLDNRACNLRWVTQKENCNNPLTIKHNSESKQGRVFTSEWKRKLSVSKKGRHWKLVDGKRIWYD